MEYYSAIKKNTFESVLMRWMKLQLCFAFKIFTKFVLLFSTLLCVCIAFFFFWSMIALQYCVSFCCTTCGELSQSNRCAMIHFCMCALSLSRAPLLSCAQSLFVTPWTAALHAPLSMRFSFFFFFRNFSFLISNTVNAYGYNSYKQMFSGVFNNFFLILFYF